MFKAVAISIFILFGALTASAQKVEVTQGFVDDSKKAFDEVVALREAKKALTETITAKNQTIQSKDETIAAKNETIKAKDETILLKDSQIENYRKIKCDKTSYLFGLIKSTRCN